MGDRKEKISIVGGGLFAGFIFMFFDAPQYIFDFLLLGLFVNWFFALFGWVSIILWLAPKGYSFFGKNSLWKKAGMWGFLDFIPGVPGLTGFIIGLMMQERAKEVLGAAGKTVET